MQKLKRICEYQDILPYDFHLVLLYCIHKWQFMIAVASINVCFQEVKPVVTKLTLIISKKTKSLIYIILNVLKYDQNVKGLFK